MLLYFLADSLAAEAVTALQKRRLCAAWCSHASGRTGLAYCLGMPGLPYPRRQQSHPARTQTHAASRHSEHQWWGLQGAYEAPPHSCLTTLPKEMWHHSMGSAPDRLGCLASSPPDSAAVAVYPLTPTHWLLHACLIHPAKDKLPTLIPRSSQLPSCSMQSVLQRASAHQPLRLLLLLPPPRPLLDAAAAAPTWLPSCSAAAASTSSAMKRVQSGTSVSGGT